MSKPPAALHTAAPSQGKDYAPLPGQSVALLQELHILTRDGKLNQDSRRKLKQVFHLYQFIEPLLRSTLEQHADICVVDHGAGKSYLGFILYDLFFKTQAPQGLMLGIERRTDLVEKSRALAQKFDFSGMRFVAAEVAQTDRATELPARIDVVTALHACDTATDDAIRFALQHDASHIVLVPCCQAELAAALRAHKAQLKSHALSPFWQHPIHTREFGSHLTNVLRCLQLQAAGYQLTVTELVGWEHSMKNELIIASKPVKPAAAAQAAARQQLDDLLASLKLPELNARFGVA